MVTLIKWKWYFKYFGLISVIKIYCKWYGWRPFPKLLNECVFIKISNKSLKILKPFTFLMCFWMSQYDEDSFYGVFTQIISVTLSDYKCEQI